MCMKINTVDTTLTLYKNIVCNDMNHIILGLRFYKLYVNFNHFERSLVHTEVDSQQGWIRHKLKTRFVPDLLNT